jgi:hypothetical protein
MKILCKIAFLVPLAAAAHEVQDNRATLILRDPTHVSVTLYISYVDAMHRAMAPRSSLEQFLVVYSAMKPDQFEREIVKAQARLEAATRLYSATGKPIAISNWSWPDTWQFHALLKHRVMQAMTDPSRHAHDEPVEIRADANASEEITSLRIQFPEEFQKVLVVSYRPTQVWVDTKSWSPAIRF